MILGKVRRSIKRYNLIKKNDKILVGVSGGPDSLALLYLLHSLAKELKFSLHIAHLDHMLRSDSYKDKEFVESIANRLKLPITTARIDVKQLSRRGSLEEIARNARLDFFFKTAKSIGATKIALGHNLDDQAETVLMRILRGTGLYGLSGILPKRNINGFCIIRPLIRIERKDIEAFLKRRKIKAHIDKSNLEDVYFRNKIRNELLPLLERKYNRNIKIVLTNLAESAGYDYDCLNRIALRALRRLSTKIKLEKFLKLHPSIQRLMLRLTIAKLKGSTRRLTFRHIKEMEDLILNRPVNSVVDLPQGISAIKTKHYLAFRSRQSPNL